MAPRLRSDLIAGEWLDAASARPSRARARPTGETIGTFPRSTAEDVDRAVAAAKAAFADWRLVPAPKRGEILFRVAHILEHEKARSPTS